MQKRKPGQPHKGWKAAARESRRTDWTVEVVQDNWVIASATATIRGEAWREAIHYAFQYIQDGEVTVREKGKKGMRLERAGS